LAIVAGVLVVGAVGLSALRQRTQAQRAAGAYYCPMHPTYTSDRPGDCPICNMRLVKREPQAAPEKPTSTATPAKDFATICYLHNCSKVHEGRPCPMTVVAKPGEKVTCPVCGTHIAEAAEPQARKVLYWTDPMIPGYKADKPGKSPMGMDLVPVYKEEHAGHAAGGPEGYAPILLSPQKQQLIGVTTASAQRRQLTKTIRTVGRIAYDPELYQAQQEYLQALRAAERAEQSALADVAEQSRKLAESSRLRLRLLGMSDALIEEMAAWEGPDQSLLLADPQHRVWLYATIYEYELPLVQVGQTLHVEFPAMPGKALEGMIRSIDPILDPQTRSARVRAVLEDAEGLLKPEMFANATIQIDAGEVLAIPRAAIFATGAAQIVFVDKGQGLFEPRAVVLGMEAEEMVEVKSGIAEGERVVTSGNFLIDSESRLKAALEGLGGHQHGE
jgi:RND family efflux transporter MFP subunit